MKIASTAIERITFMGHSFGMARVGKGYAPLKAMCQAIGVDFASQYKRLKKAHWGGVVKMTMPDQRGVLQEVVMIPRRAISMWIATIHVSQVAFSARVTIRAFQDEFVDLAEAWFFGESTRDPAMTEAVTKARAELVVLRENVDTAIKMIKIEKIRGDQIELRLDAVTKPFAEPAAVYVTLAKYHAEDPILDISGRPLGGHHIPGIGRSMTAFSKAHGVSTRKVVAPNGRMVNAYSYGLLQLWRAKQDERRLELKREYLVPAKQLKLFAS